ncbi:T cell receptor alpha variable 35 [Lemmus lemmus]
MLPECLLAILWMQITVVNSQVLSQSPHYLSIPEGKEASMSCNSSSTLTNVLWYKQDPKEGLVLLVALYKSGEVVRSGKVTAEFGGTRKDSVLTLSVSEPADTSTYFCAGQHSAPQAPTA